MRGCSLAHLQSNPSSPQEIRRDTQAITAQPQEQAEWLKVTQVPVQVEVSSESCLTDYFAVSICETFIIFFLCIFNFNV